MTIDSIYLFRLNAIRSSFRVNCRVLSDPFESFQGLSGPVGSFRILSDAFVSFRVLSGDFESFANNIINSGASGVFGCL